MATIYLNYGFRIAIWHKISSINFRTYVNFMHNIEYFYTKFLTNFWSTNWDVIKRKWIPLYKHKHSPFYFVVSPVNLINII